MSCERYWKATDAKEKIEEVKSKKKSDSNEQDVRERKRYLPCREDKFKSDM